MTRENKKTLHRWTKLLAGVWLIWFFMFHAAPAVRDLLPEFKAYAQSVEANDLHAGAIYYTDVHLVPHANLSTRSTFSCTPMGPQLAARQ